jgi:hypothetical protein
MLYFAYGSNLDIFEFRTRCPDLTPVGTYFLWDHELTFRRYANVEKKIGSAVGGALYKLSPEDQVLLDLYEGHNPSNPKESLYHKQYVFDEKYGDIMYYDMNLALSPTLKPPELEYFSIIWQGYDDWKLDKRYLCQALNSSIDYIRDMYRNFFDMYSENKPQGVTLN